MTTIVDKDISLIGNITDLMNSDYTDDSDFLIRVYKNANEHDKEVMNKVLIALCGYQLQTLIDDYKAQGIDL